MPHAAQITPAVASSSSSANAPSRAGASSVPASSSSVRPPIARPVRLTSSGSFHAGAPIPSFPSFPAPYDNGRRGPRRRDLGGGANGVRRQSTYRYTTFPTQPPKTPNDAPDSLAKGLSHNPYSGAPSDDDDDDDDENYDDDGRTKRGRGRGHRHRHTDSRGSNGHDATPLPVRQLALLALLSICEQTALNSIGPYLPTMVSSFPEIPDGEVGLYVGLLASSFACAQLLTNFLWGYVSDRVGRKPTMLLGTALLALCFAAFGLCARYRQVLVVHVAMGLLNGNAAVVPTVLGEVTDRSNQSRAFTWLPVMYSLGGITGPALGGLLVGRVAGERHPFLAPNLVAAALLAFAVVVLAVWFEETLEDADHARGRVPGLAWAKRLCSCFGRARGKKGWAGSSPGASSGSSSYLRHRQDDPDLEHSRDEQDGTGEEQSLLHAADADGKDADADETHQPQQPRNPRRRTLRQLLNWTTMGILFTYLIFQVANISFNSLYPIFATAPPPTGRSLGPGTIGVSMSLAGAATILFQVALFERLKARLGNLGTFRLSLLGLAVCMCLIPWVGYPDSYWGRMYLLAELGVILVLKNLSAVGGLSCVLLLVGFLYSSSFISNRPPSPWPVSLPSLTCWMSPPQRKVFVTDLSPCPHHPDHKLGPHQRVPRRPQRPRPDPVRRGPELRALRLGRPVHAVDAPAQGRAPGLGPVRRRRARRLGLDDGHQRAEPGERGLCRQRGR